MGKLYRKVGEGGWTEQEVNKQDTLTTRAERIHGHVRVIVGSVTGSVKGPMKFGDAANEQKPWF
jgi:hypothetical protein